jgi:hypothetical protein
LLKLTTTDSKERANDLSFVKLEARLNGSQAPHSGASDEAQQDRFCLVIESVPGGDFVQVFAQ